MLADPQSPIAPARIRTLVLPYGRIKRSRFRKFLHKLEEVSETRLRDVPQDIYEERSMFSPTGFPDGVIFFDLSMSAPSEDHFALSPFELYREPYVILAIGDGQERVQDSFGSPENGGIPNHAQEWTTTIERLQARFPRALLCRIVIFDSDENMGAAEKRQDVLLVESSREGCDAVARPIFHQMAAALLSEMTTLARSVQALPAIPSPRGPSRSTGKPAPRQGNMKGFRDTLHAGAVARSSSPAVNTRNPNRMSMPVFPSSQNLGELDGKGGSNMPPKSPPAQTFEELAEAQPGIRGLGSGNASSSNSAAASRDASRDRVSIHGFGSDSLSEKNRDKGKGRIGAIIGSIYLQAGLWPDALKELTESVVRARSHLDHIWHAKALEHILLGMLLLAWTRQDFKVPHVCYPIPERLPGSKPGQTQATNATTDEILFFSKPSEAKASFEKLTAIISDLANMILDVYARPAAISGDSLPPLVFSESSLRIAKLLSAIYLGGGVLSYDALEYLIHAKPLTENKIPRNSIHPSRSDISSILTNGLPAFGVEDMSLTDHVVILTGAASIFSSINLNRKRAIIIKELLSVLIPGLTEAKKAGAAEAGIHPSAGITTIAMFGGIRGGSSQESGDLLEILTQVYDITHSHCHSQEGQSNGELLSSIPAVCQRMLGLWPSNYTPRSDDEISIKIQVLRLCIQFAEAMSDLQGILKFASLLLRLAGPGIDPDAEADESTSGLSTEEQTLLVNLIQTTVSCAETVGLRDIEAEYWDDSLVRGIYLVDHTPLLLLHPHKRADLSRAKLDSVSKRDPFIHNPFLDRTKSKGIHNLMVASEEREFVVSLQNPFGMEIEVESLALCCANGELDFSKKDIILRPYRTQSFSLVGTITSPGTPRVTGCDVKIKGCRKRRFQFPGSIEDRDIGTASRLGHANWSQPGSQTFIGSPFPIVGQISLMVIPEQPTLRIIDSSVRQSAIMLLEGERTTVSITISNASSTIDCDFLLFSLRDSLSMAMHDAMKRKTMLPTELYEIEYQLSEFPAIRPVETNATSIAAGATEVFQFVILGKPGLTSALVQVDYANVSKTKGQDSFYTRQISLPLSVTVNASVQINRLEILPISPDFAWMRRKVKERHNLSSDQAPNLHGEQFESLLRSFDVAPNESEHCLLLFDFRNAWPAPLTTKLTLRSTTTPSPQTSTAATERGSPISPNLHTSTLTIQPGHISRQAIIIPKLHLPHRHRRIKPHNAAHERQFVVSTDRTSPETERLTRECFWFREALVERLEATWSFASHPPTSNPSLPHSGSKNHSNNDVEIPSPPPHQSGTIDLRALRLTPTMLPALTLPDLGIAVTLHGPHVAALSSRTFRLPQHTFATLRVALTNRTARPVYPLVRLAPALARLPREVALEGVERRLGIGGVRQRVVGRVEGRAEGVVEWPVWAGVCGEYEVGVVVEEVLRGREDDAKDEGQEEEGGDIEQEWDGAMVGDLGRRVWCGEEGVGILVVSESESGAKDNRAEGLRD